MEGVIGKVQLHTGMCSVHLFDAANALWVRVSDTVNKTVAEMDDVMFFAVVV